MATANPPTKRGPSVLVTDSRERKVAPTRNTKAPLPNVGSRRPPSTRLISVDNVLQFSSEIPSGQPRGPPGRHRLPIPPQSRLGRNTASGLRIPQQNIPGRSTKVSEKLVLIPETIEEKDDGEEGSLDGSSVLDGGEGGNRPLKDGEMDVLRRRGGLRGKSWAERLPKAKRKDLARVTAYSTAAGYKMQSSAKFVRERHGAKTKLYDDCLYTVYHLPLLPGFEGFRIRSSPILKSPGGKAVLDEEIERSEARDYHEGYFEDTDVYGVRGGEESPREGGGIEEGRIRREEAARRVREDARVLLHGRRPDSPNRIAPDATTFGEMFVFSYGVVVFWNFTEHQEKDILADITFSESQTGISLVSRPQTESDFETEEFHFEYSPLVDRPRVFNDMITLRSGDHMIKLAISHAIAQSTKLSFFEEKMSQTMLDAQYVPKRLALTGKLGMSRKEIVKILGRLFKSRVDVNLSSNILDVPNFFWESEPTLHPLYTAIREYLEISPRIKVLNERCRVFLDLAEILSDSIADTKMSTITWIIIALIVLSIVVTTFEVGLRFVILEREKNGGSGGKKGITRLGDGVRESRVAVVNWTEVNGGLSLQQRSMLCGAGVLGDII